MRIEELVADTFTDHEYLAPSAERIMTGVRAHAHRPGTGWPRAMAAAVAVVAVVAGTTWGAVGLRERPAPPDLSRRQSAAASTTATRAQAAPTARVIKPLTMPFDLGWLPAGSKRYVAQRINVGAASANAARVFDGEYLLDLSTPNSKLVIDAAQVPGDLTGIHFESGSGTAITINNRPGIESAHSDGPGGYEIYFQDSVGGMVYVSVSAAPGQSIAGAQASTIGRRIARGVSFPGTHQVSPSFGLGYLPPGLTVRAFDVEPAVQDSPSPDDLRTSYDIRSATGRYAVINIFSYPPPPTSGIPGRTVQGHPTRYSTVEGLTAFYLLNAVDGRPILINTALPLGEIYRIADGLELPR